MNEAPVSQPETAKDRVGGEPGQRPGIWSSLQWWPALVGAALATFTAYDLSHGIQLAPILALSGLVYLAAAAVQRPSLAWPISFVSFGVMTAAGRLTSLDPTWVALALAGLFAAYGFMRRATRPFGGLPLQALAMIGFGGIAAIALFVDGAVGAYLVAAGLAAHAAWDVYHHRRNKVVARSLAEFCFVLDLLLAAAIVIVTVQG